MFFDVTRAGTERRLRVAVAAVAYLDTLPTGSVLHLVGGQSLQVSESAGEVEDRAIATAVAAAVPQLLWSEPVTGCLGQEQPHEGEPAPLEGNAPGSVTVQEAATALDTVDWTEVLASPIAGEPASEAPAPAPKARRRRQEKAQ